MPESLACWPQSDPSDARSRHQADLDHSWQRSRRSKPPARIARGLRGLAEHFNTKSCSIYSVRKSSPMLAIPTAVRPSQNCAGGPGHCRMGFPSRRLIAITLTVRSIALPGKLEHVCKRKPPNLGMGKWSFPGPRLQNARGPHGQHLGRGRCPGQSSGAGRHAQGSRI